jgi:hypothetical protein
LQLIDQEQQVPRAEEIDLVDEGPSNSLGGHRVREKREKERGVRLGLPTGCKGSGGLHESQTLEGGMKKYFRKVYRIPGSPEKMDKAQF